MNPENVRDQLLSKLAAQNVALASDDRYYEAQTRPEAIGVSVPPAMRRLLAHVGIPRLYVDSVSERLEPQGFRVAGEPTTDEVLWQWWQANDLDIDASLGHTEALVHGRAYVTVAAPGADGSHGDLSVPVIRVESPACLYAAHDPRTKQVTAAVREVRDPDTRQLVAVTLYTPQATYVWQQQFGRLALAQTISHGLGVVPVVVLANRTRLSDAYGSSAITPELRTLTDAAARTMMHLQATAELMAVPQRLLFGVSPEEIGVDAATGEAKFDAYLARILAFDDPDGKAHQFNAADLRNFTEALAAISRQAASYTGLPPQYLSVSSDNPSSAEAIRASESRLVKTCERKQLVFGGAWEQVMRLAYLVVHGQIPPAMARLECSWREPSTPTWASKADAAVKLYAGGAGLIPLEQARIDLGYSAEQRQQMRMFDADSDAFAALEAITRAPAEAGAP